MSSRLVVWVRIGQSDLSCPLDVLQGQLDRRSLVHDVAAPLLPIVALVLHHRVAAIFRTKRAGFLVQSAVEVSGRFHLQALKLSLL